MVENGTEGIFFEWQTHFPRDGPHLSREPRLARAFLVFKGAELNVGPPKASGLVNTVKLVSGVVVEEERKTGRDGSDGVPVSGRQPEKLALEILLHGVVVADEDVTTDGLVPGKCLRWRKSFKPLVVVVVLVIIFLVIIILLMIVILPVLFPSSCFLVEMMIVIDDPLVLEI